MSRISLILHKAWQSRGRVLISRISYKCRWGLTVFYPTKQLLFWCYQRPVSGSTGCFWCTLTLFGLMHMLTVKPLSCINTLWLVVYVSYTPVKPFKVWLQWDRNIYIYIYTNTHIYKYTYKYIFGLSLMYRHNFENYRWLILKYNSGNYRTFKGIIKE